MSGTLPRQYFDEIYAARDDPWNFAESPYEKAKYADTLAALDRPCYERALEIGCSIGVLTAQLAKRCKELISVDTSEKALQQARERCAQLHNVQFFQADVPQEYPDGRFALTVLSEVGYYFQVADLARLADAVAAHTSPGGELLLVHWLPEVPDYPLTGDQVHDFFRTRSEWTPRAGFTREFYRLDLFVANDSQDSERATGSAALVAPPQRK